MYQDGGRSLPGGRDIFCKEAVAEHFRQDFALWVEEAEMSVLEAVLTRSRVSHGV